MSQDHSANTKRLAKNTLFLYGRMLIGMLVSLYTSRVILEALGVVDYGIYNVVGGFVAMFAIISTALSNATVRFLTFELGRENKSNLKEIFSTSVLIHILLCVVIIVLAETAGLWFLNYKLVIPPDRMFAANVVFQASMVSFILGILSVPYNSCILSHEKMDIFAYIGVFQIFANLIVVLIVRYCSFHWDVLIAYSILVVSVSVLVQVINMWYSLKHYPETHVRPHFFKSRWKEMGGFALWNAIGCSAGILKEQGVNVLLNLFFGPTMNASRAVAGSVNNAISSFSGNFTNALNPQVTKTYSSGDMDYCLSLVFKGARFSFYILMLISIPVLLETPYLLKLWLNKYPDGSVLFSRLILIASLIETLSSTLINLVSATGKIRNYQLIVGGLLLMNCPLSYLFLKLGYAAYSVYIVAIAVGIGCLALRLVFLNRLVGLSVKKFLKQVVLNTLMTFCCALVVPLMIYIAMPEGFLRLFILTILSVVSSALIIVYISCNANERAFILSKVVSIKQRFSKTPR